MKFAFFNRLILASALICAWGCGDDKPTSAKQDETITETAFAVSELEWWLAADQHYLIKFDYTVTDPYGKVLGKYDPETMSIVDKKGKVLVGSIDAAQLPVITPAGYVLQPSGMVVDFNGIMLGTWNSATLQITMVDGSIVDTYGNLVAAAPAKVSSSSVVSVQTPTSSASNPVTKQSSAATARSSSSPVAARPASSAVTSGGCPTIKYINGGASGSGWATRYWDCCKPSCSWNENAGGNLAKQCDRSGNKINDAGSTSICNGGNASTCLSQIPFTISGCDTYAFAFAAVPASNGGKCGHCYELTFTGEGHYNSTNANTKKLKTKGKKLIIMASNVGTDVAQGQFDIMIPGGGVGMYNGCSAFGWGNMGEQYGGLLSKCETENNYSASKYASCLTSKCNDTFKNDAKAKEGCLFLATWMEAAGNPEHNFKEVECPSELKSRY